MNTTNKNIRLENCLSDMQILLQESVKLADSLHTQIEMLEAQLDALDKDYKTLNDVYTELQWKMSK